MNLKTIPIEAGNLSSLIYVYASDDNVFGEGSETLTISQGNITNGYSVLLIQLVLRLEIMI